MKKLCLLIITICSFICSLLSQKIKVNDNIAYVNDSAFCKTKGGNLANELSFLSLDNNELIFIPASESIEFFEIVFLPSGQKAKLAVTKIGASSRNSLLKLFYNNKVIVGNAISQQGKNSFLAKYAVSEDDESNTTNSGNGTNSLTLVERNTDGEIEIKGKTIMQDGKTIGTITTTDYIDKGAILMDKYVIKLPNKSSVAEIKLQHFAAQKNSFVTFKDNKSHSLSTKAGGITTQEDTILQDAVKYLVGLKYL